jgi:hypothetical protein
MALGATRAKLGRVAIAFPFGGGLRRPPAQVANRRGCVGQAEKRLDLAFIDGLAAHLALFGSHDLRFRTNPAGQSGRQRHKYQPTHCFDTEPH